MSRITFKKFICAVLAAVFASGTVSVCLHGPDDHHYHCIAAASGHDATHEDGCGDAGGSHSKDQHICPCVSHMPVEVTRVDIPESVGVATIVYVENGFELLTGHASSLDRPPIFS